MKTASALSALLLLAAVLTVLPSAEAAQQPPPCYSVGGGCCGIEPAFAPCCGPLGCGGPPEPHCSEVRVHTSDFLAYLGPHVAVDLRGDCSIDACVDQTGAPCCTVDGASSNCGALTVCSSPPVPILMSRMALPVGVSTAIEDDCSVTVTETTTCPAGWYEERVSRDLGPVQASAENCVVPCACMPMDIAALPEVLG